MSPSTSIEQLDGKISEQHKLLTSSKTYRTRKDAEKKIDELLDARLELMKERDGKKKKESALA